MKHLAIDIGASGGKAVLGQFIDGKLEINPIRRFQHGIIDIHGHRHWDIVKICNAVKECLRAAPDADTVSVDTWGVDYGYIGRDGDLLGLPFSYRDPRVEYTVPSVHQKINHTELYKITGIQHLPFNTIYQVADDLASRPWLVENADKLLMIPELIAWFLTGIPASELTNASTSGMLDASSGRWSDVIVERIGFPPDLLPGPMPAGSVKIDLDFKISRETGSGAKYILGACHDTACAFAGVPITHSPETSAVISSGTWSLVGMEIESPIINDQSMRANFTNELGVYGTVRFLSNVTGLWLQNELQRAWVSEGRGGDDIKSGRGSQGVSFETIRREVENSPPFRSLINPDHQSFRGPYDMRLAIRTFCESTGQTVPKGIGPLMRCVFESLALVYTKRIRDIEHLTGNTIEQIHVVGGGSREPVLCQMTSDACGVKVIAGPSDATAIGNILVQGITSGVVLDLESGRAMIADSVELKYYEPRETDLWDPVHRKFDELLSVD